MDGVESSPEKMDEVEASPVEMEAVEAAHTEKEGVAVAEWKQGYIRVHAGSTHEREKFEGTKRNLFFEKSRILQWKTGRTTYLVFF
uniref:Uncharacterized protein n=1 Tax=Solanum lycopersicum TaxID=4081 RepID=A0A3Q7FE26_SOLLC